MSEPRGARGDNKPAAAQAVEPTLLWRIYAAPRPHESPHHTPCSQIEELTLYNIT